MNFKGRFRDGKGSSQVKKRVATVNVEEVKKRMRMEQAGI